MIRILKFMNKKTRIYTRFLNNNIYVADIYKIFLKSRFSNTIQYKSWYENIVWRLESCLLTYNYFKFEG